MRMVRIDVDAPLARLASIERAAYALGVQGLEILDTDTGHAPGRAGVRLYVPEGREARAATSALARALPDARIVVAPHRLPSGPSEKRNARGVKLGRGFVVRAPESIGVPRPRGDDRIVLAIDADAAFGDGVHPTTRLVVEAMERQAPSRPTQVLDVGTGTGVLGMVALSLGARELVATDVDALARRAARQAFATHVATHALDATITVQTGLPRRELAWVVANLYRDVLLTLAPRLAARVAPGGKLFVSGFGPGSRADVVAAFEARGLEKRELRSRGGWCAAVFERPT